MVYKDGKYASFGGHTVRGCGNKYAKYKRGAFIVRSCPSEPDQVKNRVVGEGLEMPNGVLFSLNKQNRWELPEVLEDAINNSTGDDECYIRYVHRHNCNRMATAVRVAATDGLAGGQHQTVKRKSRGYFQPESVFRSNLLMTKRRYQCYSFQRNRKCVTKSRRVKIKSAQPGDRTPYIRYDIITPVPDTSYLSRLSASTVVCDSQKLISDSLKEKKSNFPKSRGHTCRKAKYISIKEELGLASNYYEDEIDFSDDEYEYYMNNDVEAEHYISDVNGADADGTAIQESHLKSFIRVILQKDDIEEAKLRQCFGQSYIECQCTPRKFIISMSDKMQEIVSQMYGLTKKIRDSAYLLFVHDVINDVNTEEQPVYRVSLQTPYGSSTDVVTTLFDYMYASVEEIVGNTGFYMETLPIETYSAKDESMVNSQSREIENTLGWCTKSFRPDNTFHVNFFLSGDNQENSDLDSSFEIVCAEDNKSHCRICFDVIDSCTSGTALKLCGHTFCNGCWREYVITSVNSSRCLLTCPEFECKSEVDSGTIASFLDYNEVLKFAELCHDKHVAKAKDTIYCPSTKCRRVMRVECDSEIAHCFCGTKVCVKCSGRAHWPADCESAKSYHDTLVKTGDMRLVNDLVYSWMYVYGKNCPSCNVFVQKFEGCHQVRCWCGQSFCWGCGRLYEECDTYEVCSLRGARDRYNTSRLRFTSFDLDDAKERNPFYKLALQHRLFQNPTKVARMIGASKDAKRQVCRFLRLPVGESAMRLDFEHVNEEYTTEADKASDCLDNTVDLYMELNQTIEYGAVLLWSHEILDDDGLMLAEQLEILAREPDKLYQLIVACGYNHYPPVTIIEKLNLARSRVTSCLQNFVIMAKKLDL